MCSSSSINERIKLIRKELSLTQKEFGKRLGLSQQAIAYTEQGKNDVTDRNIESICREFNVRRDYLLYGKGDMFLDPREKAFSELCTAFHLDGSARAVTREWLFMDNRKRESVIVAVRAMRALIQKT